MAGARGYNSYRGRTPKGKILLAVALVLVILAASTFLLLQKYIEYDEFGRPHLMLPEQEPAEETTQPVEPGDLDLTIQGPEKPVDIQVYQLAAAPLTDWPSVREPLSLSAARYNAVAVTMKGPDGQVYFDAQTPAAAAAVQTTGETAAALRALLADTAYHTVARLSCFLDPRAARADLEGMGLKNTGGYLFYDGSNTNWLDPGKPAARQYLCDLAGELAALGFDEILLTDVSYPTAGKLDKIDYGETMKSQNMISFLTEMAAALETYNVTLSVELPETVVATGSDNIAGLLLSDIAPRVDRIYAATTADQAESLAAAVTAAHEGTAFVPELAAGGDRVTGGSYLRLAE